MRTRAAPISSSRFAADYESLRREIESLLAAHDNADSFIETPPADLAAETFERANCDLPTGQLIGPYKIKGAIALDPNLDEAHQRLALLYIHVDLADKSAPRGARGRRYTIPTAAPFPLSA